MEIQKPRIMSLLWGLPFFIEISMIVTYSYASLNIFSSSDDLQPEYEILYKFVATVKLEIIMLLRLYSLSSLELFLWKL